MSVVRMRMSAMLCELDVLVPQQSKAKQSRAAEAEAEAAFMHQNVNGVESSSIYRVRMVRFRYYLCL